MIARLATILAVTLFIVFIVGCNKTETSAENKNRHQGGSYAPCAGTHSCSAELARRRCHHSK